MFHHFQSFSNWKQSLYFHLQASLLVGTVEARVSSREEEPVGLIGTFVETVHNHRQVLQRAAVNNEVVYDPHLFFLP